MTCTLLSSDVSNVWQMSAAEAVEAAAQHEEKTAKEQQDRDAEAAARVEHALVFSSVCIVCCVFVDCVTNS